MITRTSPADLFAQISDSMRQRSTSRSKHNLGDPSMQQQQQSQQMQQQIQMQLQKRTSRGRLTSAPGFDTGTASPPVPYSPTGNSSATLQPKSPFESDNAGSSEFPFQRYTSTGAIQAAGAVPTADTDQYFSPPTSTSVHVQQHQQQLQPQQQQNQFPQQQAPSTHQMQQQQQQQQQQVQQHSPSNSQPQHHQRHTQQLSQHRHGEQQQQQIQQQSSVYEADSASNQTSNPHDQSDPLWKKQGEIALQLSFDDYDSSLTVHVSRAKGLEPMDLNGLADPFVKIRLMPDPTESQDLIRQTKYMSNTLEPDWQQTVVFMDVPKRELRKRWFDVSVWDYDRLKTNDFMGRCSIRLERKILDNKLHWFTLYSHEKEMPAPPGCLAAQQASAGQSTSKENHSGSRHAKEGHRTGDSREAFDSSTTNYVPKIQVTDDLSQMQPHHQHHLTLQQQQQQQQHTANSTIGNFVGSSNADKSLQQQQQWMLTRCDTVESKSSNSSSVNTDFLTEDQREVVRRWLGPGQLLLMNDELKTERGGDLPDDSLVSGEIFLILRKISGEGNLQVTVKQCRSLTIGGSSEPPVTDIFCKLCLLYGDQFLSKAMKRRTKVQKYLKDGATFAETFVFNSRLDGMLLQVGLWACKVGLKTDRRVGEAVIFLEDIECVPKNSKKAVQGWYKLLRAEGDA